MKLSKNLTLSEVTDSPTAKRLGISNQPTPEHLENLKKIAENIFEPIRNHFDVPIYISSGYRSAALNKAIKGSSKTSQHLEGEALDLDQQGKGNGLTNKQVFDFIKDNLNFTQLIFEMGSETEPDWVHVGYDEKRLTKQVLRATRVNGKPVYNPY
jgi:zinc D-Ala-D-Ala carboxypeptidase